MIFKYFSKWNIDLLTAIVVNYYTAFLVGLMVDGKDILSTNPFTAPWFSPLMIMGVCFILGFNLIALTVRHAGITITTIMQKITFLAVVFYALIVFKESANWIKLVGVACASVAVILVSAPGRRKGKGERGKGKEEKIKSWILLLPILTFLVSSVIDVTFYHITYKNIASSTDIPFIAYIFLTAGILGSIYWLITVEMRGERPLDLIRHIRAGILLGVPNFFSIYFLMAMLESGWSGSILYPINNLGILLFASMCGWLIFGERLDRKHVWGFFLSLLAISALIASNYL